MPEQFRSASCTITWHGIDHTTPPGHTIALGTDSIRCMYLWLFRGDKPTDEAFIGSIMIPRESVHRLVAYGKTGLYVGVVENTTETLAKLAAVSKK